MMLRAAFITKESSGPLGLYADDWWQMLVSYSFDTASSDLCNSTADFIKKLCCERTNF